jgi:hypothetical protein
MNESRGATFGFTSKGYRPRLGEIRFDMFEAEFTREGDRGTFEVLQRNDVDKPALAAIAEDRVRPRPRDGKFARAEAGGIAALIDGLARADISDQARVEQGGMFFDNLYTLFSKGQRESWCSVSV